jgi:hypothetical protein
LGRPSHLEACFRSTGRPESSLWIDAVENSIGQERTFSLVSKIGSPPHRPHQRIAIIAHGVYIYGTDYSTGLIGIAMRAGLLVLAVILFEASAAFAGGPMAPSDIEATFFNGQPFTAASPTGTKFTMTFTPDGRMTREPLAHTGYKNNGAWKLNAKGFCTTWQHAKPNCFTVVPNGENKWSVLNGGTTIATTIAVWSK